MQAFDYVTPRTVAEAAKLLLDGGDGARILAGGTDIIVQIREGRKSAKLVVDIKEIPDLNELSFDAKQGLILGAAVPCYKITSDKKILTAYPGLMDAIAIIGGVQIQGRASVGGNLCNASPAADAIPALIVHEAICLIAGLKNVGQTSPSAHLADETSAPLSFRELPVEKFCVGVGKTALQKGELLVALRIPPPKKDFGAHYLRFIPRNEMDIAVVGVGAAVMLDEKKEKFVSARIALGAVAPTPLLVEEAGAALAGKEISDEPIAKAAEIAKAAAKPISDMRGSAAQRKHLVGVLTRRAIEGAIERAKR